MIRVASAPYWKGADEARQIRLRAAFLRMSIATLAQAAAVSEPTVNRFCRNFDAKGYPDFKIKLAQSLAGGTPYVSRSVERDDDASSYGDKIFGATIAALDDARRALDAKRRMLVGHYIIFVFWIDGLVVRRHVDLVVGKLVFAEVLEEVGVSGTVEVDVCIA